MNINRLVPVGPRFIRLVISNRIVNNSRKMQFSYIRNLRLKVYVALAFIWPAKRNETIKNGSNETKVMLPSILEKADNLFENGHYEECYRYLTTSEAIEGQKEVEIQWRICRVLYNMAQDLKYKKDYKKELIFLAYEIISKQLQENSENFAVQKWYALLLDAKSSYAGMKERIIQLENVKKHMDLAITINPDDATTLHMLGEWCYQVTEMPWHQRKLAETLFAALPQSTYEDALEYFLRAEAVQPRFYSLNLLRLGSCYLKLKKEDQAKYYLKLAACYPAKSNDDHRANKEATELLKKLK